MSKIDAKFFDREEGGAAYVKGVGCFRKSSTWPLSRVNLIQGAKGLFVKKIEDAPCCSK